MARAGKPAESEEHYREVVRLKPEYVAARMALADVLAKQGNSADAVEQLRQALKQQPRSVMVYERMGDVEKSRGDASAAREAYQKALEYASDPSERKRLRRKLESGRSPRSTEPRP